MNNKYIDWDKIGIDCMLGMAPWWIQKPYDLFTGVREIILPSNHTNWLWKLVFWFNPRQSWIKNHIEYYEWQDKPELITDFMFGCIIHLVEEEEYVGKFVSETKNEITFDKQLLECYDYIKIQRPKMIKDMEKSPVGSEWEKIYELDEKWLIWIVKHKESMWT